MGRGKRNAEREPNISKNSFDEHVRGCLHWDEKKGGVRREEGAVIAAYQTLSGERAEKGSVTKRLLTEIECFSK